MTDASFDAGGLGNAASAHSAQAWPSPSSREALPPIALARADRVARSLLRAIPEGAPRFLVAGGLASLFNWLVRFPLSDILPFELAVGVAYAFGMGVGFALYRSWVFPGSTLPLPTQASRFIAVNTAGVGVVMISAKLLVVAVESSALLPISTAEGVAHAFAIVLGAVLNFLGHRALTFARGAAASRSAASG